jgi:hypothetical protein
MVGLAALARRKPSRRQRGIEAAAAKRCWTCAERYYLGREVAPTGPGNQVGAAGPMQPAKPPRGPARSSNRPTTQESESISALPPQMGMMLIWSVFSSITRPLLSHRLVVGQQSQDPLVRSLLHASRLNWHDTARSPLEPCAQFLHATGRAVPPVAHSGLIGDASTFAAPEKPDAVVVIPGIEDPRRAVALWAREHEVSPAIASFPPVAENVLRYTV